MTFLNDIFSLKSTRERNIYLQAQCTRSSKTLFPTHTNGIYCFLFKQITYNIKLLQREKWKIMRNPLDESPHEQHKWNDRFTGSAITHTIENPLGTHVENITCVQMRRKCVVLNTPTLSVRFSIHNLPTRFNYTMPALHLRCYHLSCSCSLHKSTPAGRRSSLHNYVR